jgi:RNA polymerase sigma factor (sigma-70 family)
MAPAPVTRPTLLLRLRDPHNNEAWAQFVAIYTPLIFGFLRKKGLQDADASDVTQEVLKAVSQGMPRLDYDPKRGSFRGWLFTVVRNKLRDFQQRGGVKMSTGNDTEAIHFLEKQSAPEPDEEIQWQQEYWQRLFSWAAEQVKTTVEESTWQAFWLTAVEGKKAGEAAKTLNLSVTAVYMAKSRVLARIKEQIQQVQGEDGHDGPQSMS